MRALIKTTKEILALTGEIQDTYTINGATITQDNLEELIGIQGEWMDVADCENALTSFSGLDFAVPADFIKTIAFNNVDEFDDLLIPIANPNEDGETVLFETYGADLEYVLSIANTEPNRVWTLIDGDDDELYVSKGYHIVNRFGYNITTKECPFDVEDFLYVEMDN